MSDENLPLEWKAALEEWKAALENARSFNTLLLQLRGFGIPIVITIMGGGVAFASKIDIPTIPVKYYSFVLIVIAVVLFCTMAAIYRAAKGKTDETKIAALTKTEIWEGIILGLVPISGLGISLGFYYRDFFNNAFVVSSPGVVGTILFALSLLLGLYGIDRCYYYKLLMGAVKRASKLESDLRFSLTKTISDVTPLEHSKNFITTMYWLPALGALMAVVILGYLRLWTGHSEAMSGGLIKCLEEVLK